MTVEELETILGTVKNKKLPVCMNSYYVQDVNGYFFSDRDSEEVLMLTNNHVQPLISTKV